MADRHVFLVVDGAGQAFVATQPAHEVDRQQGIGSVDDQLVGQGIRIGEHQGTGFLFGFGTLADGGGQLVGLSYLLAGVELEVAVEIVPGAGLGVKHEVHTGGVGRRLVDSGEKSRPQQNHGQAKSERAQRGHRGVAGVAAGGDADAVWFLPRACPKDLVVGQGGGIEVKRKSVE